MDINEIKVGDLQQIEGYVDQMMSNNINVSEVAPVVSPVVKDFIPSDVECVANLAFANPFLLDDRQMYIDFLNKALSQSSIEKLQAYVPNTALICFNYVTEYFGHQIKGLREQINEAQGGIHSITKYKDNNSAVCFERATVTHNLLKLLGIQDSLILNNAHAYNMIDCGNVHLLLDVTNWVHFKGDGIDIHLPILQKVTADEYNDFYYGKNSIDFNPQALTRLANLLYPDKNLQIVDDFNFSYAGLNQTKEEVLGL